MDETERHITKIARTAQRYAAQRLRNLGLGTSEYESLHYIRKRDGMTQDELAGLLSIDKSAASRMLTSLEKKGFVERRPSKTDGRVRCIFATDRARALRGTTNSVEAYFYEWLLADVADGDKEAFLRVLTALYRKSKEERRAGFVHIGEVERP